MDLIDPNDPNKLHPDVVKIVEGVLAKLNAEVDKFTRVKGGFSKKQAQDMKAGMSDGAWGVARAIAFPSHR